MQAQKAILTFSEAEKPLGDRLIKIAVETDRVEGYSEPHAIAIARMAEKIGAQMGLHGIDLTALKFAALAHDLGERAMKRNYLLRPGVLGWEETLDLWRHPILGEQAAGELGLSRQTQLLIRWHHEWWNGQGYPDGLAGEAIPAGARILRAVDSYFALISNRPQRARFDRIEAEQIIADLAGIEFDPQAIKLLLASLAEERRSREAEFLIAPAETAAAAGYLESESQPAVAEIAAQSIAPQPEPAAFVPAATPVDEAGADQKPSPETDEIAPEIGPLAQSDEPAGPRTLVEDETAPASESVEAEAQNREAKTADETSQAPQPKVEN